MQRVILRVYVVLASGLLGVVAPAQQTDGAPSALTADQLTQLRSCREGILDPQARPKERRRWAELLLTLDSPGAKALVVEFLALTARSDVQQAMCDVIAWRSRVARGRSVGGYVDPLIDLLGGESEDLRSAAANALASIPDAGIPAKLGAIAGQSDVAMVKRLAAIDALASKIDRRSVVRELMGLLEAGVAEINERVVTALEPASPETFGSDLDRWKHWWREKSQLSEEAWLADQLKMYRDRFRRVEQEGRTFRERARRREETTIGRLAEFQREIFRSLGAEDQEVKLTEWLDDTVKQVRLAALAIIKARIADEGQRPGKSVLAALLRVMAGGEPAIRREALLIVQTLQDPWVVEAVLAQLEKEYDPATRLAMLRAVGQLNSSKAVPALIREIADPHAHMDCVREAANALGQITSRDGAADRSSEAVIALTARYRSVPKADDALRAALLAAMAGVADASFAPIFAESVDSGSGDLVRPAIRGMLAIGDGSRLPRLRTLVADADPLIRMAAVVAVGKLGREEVDVECLLARLNPNSESDEQVRDAAWLGFQEVLSDRSLADRIEAAGRLRETPDLELRYLSELAEVAAAGNGEQALLDGILDRMGALLVSQGKYEEAIPHLRRLYEMRTPRGNAEDAAMRWFEASLRAPVPNNLVDSLARLAGHPAADATRAKVVAVVDAYVESEEVTGDPRRARVLLEEMKTVSAPRFGPDWTRLCERLNERLDALGEGKESKSAP